MNEPYHDKETLREAYLELGSQKDVAERFDVSWYTIQEWMSRFDIPTFQKPPDHPLYDKRTLFSLYQKHNSIDAVAEELDVSSNSVGKWMEVFDIEKNQNHPNRGEKKTVQCYNCGKEKTVYVSFLTNGQKFCNQDCQGEWMSENRTGKSHPNYKGGKQVYGTGWKDAKQRVWERDRNICQVCGDSREDIGKRPDVHHIRPRRDFDTLADAHSLDNLVQLCGSCHRQLEQLPEPEQRKLIQ